MTTLQLTEEQLRLVQHALDFYSRVGIGQMWVIKDHPTFESALTDKLSPKKPIEVGDRTMRGDVVEIGEGYIKTKGSWGNGEEVKTWTDVDKVKHSIDWSLYHEIRENATKLLNQGRNQLLQEEFGDNGSYGIYSPNVDESCRVAWDILQVIRHEFWKKNETRSQNTVDSSIMLSTENSDKIKCQID